jgi:hypothetical protein
MEVSGQLCTPTTLPPGKEFQYPLDRRLGRIPDAVTKNIYMELSMCIIKMHNYHVKHFSN